MNHEAPTERIFQKEGPQLQSSKATYLSMVYLRTPGEEQKEEGEREVRADSGKAWTFSDLAGTGKDVI